MNKWVLYGAGGHAKVVYDMLVSNNFLLEYIVNDYPAHEFFKTFDVFKPSEELLKNKKVVVAIGNNEERQAIVNKIKNICSFDVVIHQSAYVSKFTQVGVGTVIMPQVCINADVKIGEHCIINTSSIIEHDCVIEDFVHVSPGVALAGNVTIKKGAQIGIGARVIPGVTIGAHAVIGAGSVVIRDVPDDATVVGNPAKIIKILSVK